MKQKPTKEFKSSTESHDGDSAKRKPAKKSAELAKEVNGPKGLEPTRYGDWESKGRCYDF